MSNEAEVPPKSEWKVYRVEYESYERGSVFVLAPSSGDATDAVQHRAETRGDLPMDSEGFDVDPEDNVREITTEMVGDGRTRAPDFEWEPKEKRPTACSHHQETGFVVTCDSCRSLEPLRALDAKVD